MIEAPRLITVALRDFAVPVPRTGSIEAFSGYGQAAAEGRELHARIQKRRAKADPSYEAEVPVSRSFDREGYRFRVDGRMDGIFRQNPPKIEEIKTSFDIRELSRRLSGTAQVHPYTLQLVTYGYFYWLEHKVVPGLSFHLVSSRSSASLDIQLKLDRADYERWLDLRLAELVAETRKAEKRAARRRKLVRSFPFPFADPRPGQRELMRAIEESMSGNRPMLVQAPTGLGKTAGVLHPVLKEALARGQTTIYVTPKNSQHSVAEDAVDRFRGSGANVKSLTITAKGKICFKNEPLCTPDYCEYAADHYRKVHEHALPDILSRKKKLTSRVFRALGERYQVCPFELQLDAAPEADVVICDYNYVFAPRSALGRVSMMAVDQDGRPNLVIDEAHNLPARAMDYYSPSLSCAVLDEMRSEVRGLPARFRQEAEELLDGCIRVVASCAAQGRQAPSRIEPPTDAFFCQESLLTAFLSRYLDSGAEIQARDVVLRLCRSWSEFTEALEYAGDPQHREFFVTYHPHPSGGAVKITCCDASAMLREKYAGFQQVVAFSATLKPFDFYAKLSGLDPDTVTTAEFGSPFPRQNRKIVIIPQVSTKYADRERNYPRIADAIRRIVEQHRGNYFAFFPSFEFLARVLALFQPPEGFAVIKQEPEMRAARIGEVLERLRERSAPTILFAVQGGVFSEGVDYPGEMAIGAFVVGPPLPVFDLEREEMRAYYEEKYGAGFDYAYAIPAMTKAVQAAGRVIRSGTDRGLIVLLDNRFVQPAYARSLPADWFEKSADELVSDRILQDVSDFWRRSNGTAERETP